MKKIRQNNQCPTQEVFTKCVRSWLESPETIILDVSSVHESQCELIQKAIADQDQIGWHTAMQGYLSKHWRLAISVNHHLEENNDKGEVWVHKTVVLLWDFAHEMWDHQNSVLHNTKLKASHAMRYAEINHVITKLFTQQRIDGTLMFCWPFDCISH
jgi:hypothetical protein